MIVYHAGQGAKTKAYEVLLFSAGTFFGNEQRLKEVEAMFCFAAGNDIANSRKTDRCERMFYFAAATLGDCKDSPTLEKYIGNGLRNRLLSYADIEKVKGAFKFWMGEGPPGKKLFLDSGAYSAFNSGTKIDIEKYVDYIKQNQSAIYCYAALDVIGDPVATKKNYERMVAMGTSPIPAFHVGSEMKELEWYCERCDYIALGGLVPLTRRPDVMRAHLDRCWTVIKRYWPKRVHAFGVTTQRVLERYPFFSCDSTSAIMGGGMGRIIKFENRKLSNTAWRDQGAIGLNAGLVDGLQKEGSQHLARRIHNVGELVKFERYITELWAKRGVVWDD